MSFGKTAQRFSAVLKSLDDKIMEYGTACVSAEEQSIDFENEFVPICKLGSRLKIICLEGELETHSFTGEVYLSSQQLLRLVSVTDEVLPGAASAYLYDTQLSGIAAAVIVPEEHHPKRFSLLGKPSGPASHVFPISIHAISLTEVKFTCDMALSKEQQLTMTVDRPFHLDEIPLEVEVPITFGTEHTGSYRCRILGLEGQNYLNLEAHVRELSLAADKLFPPVTSSGEEAP